LLVIQAALAREVI
jgi:hypothetical protein